MNMFAKIFLILCCSLSLLVGTPSQIIIVSTTESADSNQTLTSHGKERASVLPDYFSSNFGSFSAIFGSKQVPTTIPSIGPTSYAQKIPVHLNYSLSNPDALVAEILNNPNYDRKKVLIFWPYSSAISLLQSFGYTSQSLAPAYDITYVLNYPKTTSTAPGYNQALLWGDGGTGPIPPPPPGPPPANYLPIVIQNNSNVSQTIWLSVIGTNHTTKNLEYLTLTSPIDDAVGTWVDVTTVADDTIIPSYAINATGNMTTIYLPPVSGGRFYFSVENKLNMKTKSSNSIITPSVTNPSLPEYNTMFDTVELAYIEGAGNNSVNPNATAVAFFSMPLHTNLSTPAAGSSATTGFALSDEVKRSDIFLYVNSLFTTIPTSNNATEKANIEKNWTNLFSPSNTPASALRILAPATAMTLNDPAAPWALKYAFDPNYLDNETAYGFSFLKDVWYNPGSYYRTNSTELNIKSPLGTMLTYAGTIQGTMKSDSGVCFTPCPQAGPPVCMTTGCQVFDPPTTASSGYNTTTWKIFGAENLGTYPTADGEDNQVSKLFEEAIIAGLIPHMYPSGTPLSNNFFLATGTASYYNQTGFQNPSLMPPNMSAPWYDLYSRALHTVDGRVPGVNGQIYTYGFDEPLWPAVKSNGPFTPGSTKVTITIGDLK